MEYALISEKMNGEGLQERINIECVQKQIQC